MHPAHLSDQIANRVNCYGIADWLTWLAASYSKTFYDLFPISAVARHEVCVPQLGCTLTFRHPHAGHAEVADPQRWILESAVFDPLIAHLPFGLDAQSETPDSAKEKLDNDAAAGKSRISYFLPDARVVELTFASTGKGLARLQIVRLGVEMEYDEASHGIALGIVA